MEIVGIAAVARNGVIGVNGGLPWLLPGDLPRVKALTTGHVLVMGRKTIDSIGRALPGRSTVVVTRQPGWSAEDVHVAASVSQAIEVAASIDDPIFVFGGAIMKARMQATPVEPARERGDG
jgi:dihydrofolate reductase